MATYKTCVDVNPNSNGILSQQAASNALATELSPTNFLSATSATLNIGKGTAFTRNIKLFKNCVTACHTREQEVLLKTTLETLHKDIMAFDSKKKSSDPGIASKRNIASLASVEKAVSYSRKKPVNSPSR